MLIQGEGLIQPHVSYTDHEQEHADNLTLLPEDYLPSKMDVIVIDELAFEVGTNRCHKGEVFRL
jgi:hypothetical protein